MMSFEDLRRIPIDKDRRAVFVVQGRHVTYAVKFCGVRSRYRVWHQPGYLKSIVLND